MRNRLYIIIATAALILAACGSGAGDEADEPDPDPTATTSRDASEPDTTIDLSTPVASALDDMNDPSFPEPLVDPQQIISGGPPPDGIPPIDAPQFVPAADVDWLSEDEPVVYLELNGEVHAYPVQILIWHEIVNDTVGGVPVAVTYCPLCNSAVTYRREINGEETTFGTSGRLFASALVMYDRTTESLWTHYNGQAVVGALTGAQLEPISSPLLAWSDFLEAFPDAEVLDRDATGHSRPYGDNPYVGYDDPGSEPFLFRGTVDDRAVAKQRVVGVAIGEEARAWALEAISGGQAQATNSTLGDTPLVILWKSGQSSALDAGAVDEGKDVGSVGVFSSVVDGQTLTFTVDGETFVDEQTGSEWDITGQSIAGDLSGTTLEKINHLDTFWFSWSTYEPETDLIDS